MRLKERHPHLFEEAKRYEEESARNGVDFSWNERETLAELERPERMAEIVANWEATQERKRANRSNLPLITTLGGREVEDDQDDVAGCLICSL